jgi:hypothetical protein
MGRKPGDPSNKGPNASNRITHACQLGFCHKCKARWCRCPCHGARG